MKSFLKTLLIISVPITLGTMVAFYFSNDLMLKSAQRELRNDMRDKWEIVALHLQSGSRAIDTYRLIRAISEKTELRITIIEETGRVIDDSYFTKEEVARLENHRDRPEIVEAINHQEGYVVRYSTTTEMDMVYFARKMTDSVILRLSYPATYINIIKHEFTRQNLYIFFLSLSIILLIAIYLASRISKPIQKLDHIAQQIELGKSEIQFPSFRDPSMIKIANMIKRIYTSMINEQIQLQQEQEKLEHVFRILEEGIILLDNSNNIIHFNDKAANYLNISLKQMTNLLTDIRDEEIRRFFQDILSVDQNKLWKSKELKDALFEVNLTIHKEEKLIVFFNVTRERQYELYKYELIENISHELKTPLSMILGYAETILGDPEMTRPMLNRFLNKIFSASKRINGIINDLLEIHKLESSGRTIVPEIPTVLAEVIQDVKNRFLDNLTKVIQFNTEVEEVMVHYEHLFSIITNLTENAVKYSRGNYIYVTISRKGKQVSIIVEDEGPPIPNEERDRIFERFYTVSRSRNKKESGSGLGLPIVKHISQLYGGNVYVTSSEHGGNLFTVTLYEA